MTGLQSSSPKPLPTKTQTQDSSKNLAGDDYSLENYYRNSSVAGISKVATQSSLMTKPQRQNNLLLIAGGTFIAISIGFIVYIFIKLRVQS